MKLIYEDKVNIAKDYKKLGSNLTAKKWQISRRHVVTLEVVFLFLVKVQSFHISQLIFTSNELKKSLIGHTKTTRTSIATGSLKTYLLA